VDYRVLTVSREYGSGGGRIAGIVAGWLGWRLLDNELITAVARAARVESRVVRHYDEHVDSWLRRLNEEAIRGVAMAAGRPLNEEDIFDAHSMAALTRRIIEEARGAGNCVIVGRGAQCILEHKPDVYHAFIYAPMRERMRRLQKRLEAGTDIAERIRTIDTERARYLQQTFGKTWCDHHLYDLMLRSEEDEEQTARILYYAMTGTSY
jgi:hypothetical protein